MKNVQLWYEFLDCFFALDVDDSVERFSEVTIECFLEVEDDCIYKQLKFISFGRYLNVLTFFWLYCYFIVISCSI